MIYLFHYHFQAGTIVIHFDNVSKQYNRGSDALCEVTFTIEKGEMVFITGHSGAGKSTLLKLITAMDRVSMGDIWVGGHHLTNLSSHRVPMVRRFMGVIFQDHRLLTDRSVFDNVALPLEIAGYSNYDINRRVRAALDKVGLLHKEKYQPLALSGGEQQRVGIARAVVNKPALLIADEPSGNLDADLSAEMMHLLEEFNRVGVTIVIATHNTQLIQPHRHGVLTLRQGRLLPEAQGVYL